MFKAYTRKSSAMTGAQRAGLDTAAVVKNGDQWGFYLPDKQGNLPKLGGKAAAAAQTATDTVVQVALSGVDKLATSTVEMMSKVNDTLGDIKELIFEENQREAKEDSAAKLKQLEADREKEKVKEKSPSFISRLKDNADGFLKLLKALSLPLVIGAITGLDKKLNFLKNTREKLSEWAGKLQVQLDEIAEIPLFKNNILGKGIKNALPIAGAFGLLALWKPGAALKMLSGVGKFIKFFGNNPAVKGLEKLPSILPALEGMGKLGGVLSKIARVGGKIFLPITIITSLWETVSGAIDGYKNGGIAGAFKGALDGLVHGLIGGLIDTVSQGIGWILEQFGIEAEGFKNFKFGKFLEELGSNLGIFLFDMIDSIKAAFGEAMDGLAAIFDSDASFLEKVMKLITFPFSFIVDKIKKTFGGLSPMEIIKKVMSFATANNAVGRAAVAASQPAPKAPGPTVNLITPRDPTSMQIRPPARPGVTPSGISGSVTGNKGSAEIVANMLRKHEGFSDKAYWDVNAYRAGYGSDTVTRADGSVERVTKDTVVTKQDAERDLHRRIAEFQGQLAREVGVDKWNALNEQTKAALTSVGYNYGSFRNLSALKAAIGTGDTNKIADAVAGLQGHNNGINRNRRLSEAADIRASVNAVPRAATGAGLTSATEAVDASKRASGGVTVAPVNANRTTISNQTQNHMPNLSASTPVEFAPHVS